MGVAKEKRMRFLLRHCFRIPLVITDPNSVKMELTFFFLIVHTLTAAHGETKSETTCHLLLLWDCLSSASTCLPLAQLTWLLRAHCSLWNVSVTRRQAALPLSPEKASRGKLFRPSLSAGGAFGLTCIQRRLGLSQGIWVMFTTNHTL